MRKIFFIKALIVLTFTTSYNELFAQADIDPIAKAIAERDSIFYSNLGKPYLSFSIQSLANDVFTEQSLKGKVTLINFWFTGCAPCIAEFGDLNRLYHKYKNNPNVQLISITKDDTELALKTAQKYQLAYPVCPVELKECYRLNLHSGFPTNIVVDKTGKIVYLNLGSSFEKDRIEKFFIEAE